MSAAMDRAMMAMSIEEEDKPVVLTNERFQFFFKTEHDLEEILDKGVQTFNEWEVAMERWEERTTTEFLQFVPLWVQIINVPVNHYRSQTIWDIGDNLGEVKEIAFDETKQSKQSV